MRIAMLTQFYPPVIGGIERHVQNLSKELTKRGHTVCVVTLWQPELAEHEVIDGIEIHRIRGTVHRAAGLLFENAAHAYAPPLPDPELVFRLRARLKDFNPDIIHAHNWIVHSFLPIKRAFNAPLIVTLHDYDLHCPKWTLTYKGDICDGPALGKCADCLTDNYGRIKGLVTLGGSRVMTAWERRAVDLFVPVSTAVAEGSALVGSRYPYEVIPNFIPDQLPPEPTDGRLDPYLNQLPDGDFLLFVGSFGKHKGFDVLVEAYRKLNTSMPLVLIGYVLPELDINTITMPENVIVCTNFPNEAVLAAFRRCSVAIVPSNWGEPCPTVAMEAMACGRAVVASGAGGLTDIVADGETGLLVPPGDAEALAGALAKLIDAPQTRADMGARGQVKVAEFQAATVVERIEAMYRRVLSEKQGQPAL